MEPAVPFLFTVEFDGGVELLRPAARLQILARKHGFKPTWLVGAESLRHPAALEPLGRWQREGEAEVGVLLEAASVPPLVELPGQPAGRRPFLTDFPDSVMLEKVAWFTSSLAQIVGRSPTSLRAVRPSVDERFYSTLAKNGYRTDLTVVPHAKIDTSDFTAYPEKAYMTPQGVFEVPRTVRRRRYGTFIEDLLVLPGQAGAVARWLFPSLRCLRLRAGNRSEVRKLLFTAKNDHPGHLDLRISSRDWARGDALLRDVDRSLALARPWALPLTAEEFHQRFKHEQLRKGLV